MPDALRRKLQGPATSTGRGITASGDRRVNVRLSLAEDDFLEARARERNQTKAELLREVGLKALGYEPATPEKPAITAPWLVDDTTTPEGTLPAASTPDEARLAELGSEDLDDEEPSESTSRPTPAPPKPKRPRKRRGPPPPPPVRDVGPPHRRGADDESLGSVVKGFLRRLLK